MTKNSGIPFLGPNVPRFGNALSNLIGRTILKSMRWKIRGEIPNLKKFIAIGAPHTSNWDFVVGMAALMSLGIRVHWLGKDSIFKWPVKYIWHWLGGRPVNRKQSSGVVEQVVEFFASSDQFVLGLSPEGTRHYIPKWRTGFYHIAVRASVPLLPVFFDFEHRSLTINPLFHPSGDLNRDMHKILDLFRPVRGKRPKKLPENSQYPVDP